MLKIISMLFHTSEKFLGIVSLPIPDIHRGKYRCDTFHFSAGLGYTSLYKLREIPYYNQIAQSTCNDFTDWFNLYAPPFLSRLREIWEEMLFLKQWIFLKNCLCCVEFQQVCIIHSPQPGYTLGGSSIHTTCSFLYLFHLVTSKQSVS